ncbi:MAG: SprT-like domain-containing protein [Clostridia bacterium]|nr:SprT-like domain-containing protein [Clostridia bacterium]
MEEKLEILYRECISELESIGIYLNEDIIGKIDIKISPRKAKRYGCCKQEEPDERFYHIVKVGRRRIKKYERFKKHHIEISKWVMDLDEGIIKNTIIHEIIHCFPGCNDHGDNFKKYSKYINEKLGYSISRLGNKEEDFKKSNLEFREDSSYKYKIVCVNCGQEIYRKRLNRNLLYRYRCGKCNGKLMLV